MPVPLPAFNTFRVLKPTAVTILKVAVTLLALSIVTTQVSEPLHSPPQPRNVLPVAAVAVKATSVPETKSELQTDAVQLLIGEAPAAAVLVTLPTGALVIVPVPLPARKTVKVKLLGDNFLTKVAVTP